MHPVIWIPVTIALVVRARKRNSLTTGGIVAAVGTAVAHASHPWSIFFALLVVFFLAGTAVTKVKHDVKAKLTRSAAGESGGEGPRGWIQVLANSGVASVLILLHGTLIQFSDERLFCFPRRVDAADLIAFGIVGNYVAVAADTFSSELGILAKSKPRLVTAPWKVVPKGTNGGVTIIGLLAGALGALFISIVTVVLLPFCSSVTPPNSKFIGSLQTTGWDLTDKAEFVASMTAVGVAGSVLDSVLGAIFQASIVERKSGKVVEGEGGRKVAIPSSSAQKEKANAEWQVATGWDLLSNNGVNLVMAATMSAVSIYGAAIVFDVDLFQLFHE